MLPGPHSLAGIPATGNTLVVRTLKDLVPGPWRRPLRTAYTRLRYAGRKYRCNICGAGLSGFLPHGIPPALNYLCPLCYSKPPHRLAAVYLDSHPELFVEDGLMLHVAPEFGLGRTLSAQARRFGMRYRAGGISGVGDTYIDLLNLPFENSSVGLVYCCHVLNSHQGLTTLESHNAAERMDTFGDDGIYRCYTNEDYEARLRAAGFAVKAFRADDVADNLVQRYQLKREVLHLCRKRDGGRA
jgi:hypothetical protein